MKFADVRKCAVAVAGAVGQLVAIGLVHGTALEWCQVLLAAATAAGVYTIPNG